MEQPPLSTLPLLPLTPAERTAEVLRREQEARLLPGYDTRKVSIFCWGCTVGWAPNRPNFVAVVFSVDTMGQAETLVRAACTCDVLGQWVAAPLVLSNSPDALVVFQRHLLRIACRLGIQSRTKTVKRALKAPGGWHPHGPLRAVVSREPFRGPHTALGEGSVRETLSCGHTIIRKQSAPATNRRCYICNELNVSTNCQPKPS